MTTDARAAELVTVPRTTHASLAAAWYPADTDTALLHLHGKGGNFYTGPSLIVPQYDTARRFAHLALNMTCHDLGYTRYDTVMPDVNEGYITVAGGMWEQLSDGVPDICAALDWLEARGIRKTVIVGHSSGAYYAVMAAAEQANRVAGIALLSTVLSYKRNLQSWFPGPDGLDDAVRQARSLVEAGLGYQILSMPVWYYAISADSLLDRVRLPDDAFARMTERLRCPVLVGCGAKEPRVEQWREMYNSLDVPSKRWLLLPGVGHDYIGAESLLTDGVFAFAAEAAASSQ